MAKQQQAKNRRGKDCGGHEDTPCRKNTSKRGINTLVYMGGSRGGATGPWPPPNALRVCFGPPQRNSEPSHQCYQRLKNFSRSWNIYPILESLKKVKIKILKNLQWLHKSRIKWERERERERERIRWCPADAYKYNTRPTVPHRPRRHSGRQYWQTSPSASAFVLLRWSLVSVSSELKLKEFVKSLLIYFHPMSWCIIHLKNLIICPTRTQWKFHCVLVGQMSFEGGGWAPLSSTEGRGAHFLRHSGLYRSLR